MFMMHIILKENEQPFVLALLIEHIEMEIWFCGKAAELLKLKANYVMETMFFCFISFIYNFIL